MLSGDVNIQKRAKLFQGINDAQIIDECFAHRAVTTVYVTE